MNHLEYVTALAELNSSYITPGNIPNCVVFNALAWGLAEELLEYEDASSHEEVIKEAGDVLAYATLLLLTQASIVEVAECLEIGTVLPFNPLAYFSNLKRMNREGEKFLWIEALKAWCDTFEQAEDFHSLSFEEIAQANIDKLQDRAKRNVMFQGAGNNR